MRTKRAWTAAEVDPQFCKVPHAPGRALPGGALHDTLRLQRGTVAFAAELDQMRESRRRAQSARSYRDRNPHTLPYH